MLSSSIAIKLQECYSDSRVCSVCLKQCTKLDAHAIDHHSELCCLQCIYCLKFCHIRTLKSHLAIHENSPASTIYSCSACSSKHHSLRDYIHHGFKETSCAPSVLKQCPLCFTSFFRPFELIKHLRCVKIELFECTGHQCHVKSPVFEEILEHCERVHGSGADSVRFQTDFICGWPEPSRPIAQEGMDSTPKAGRSLGLYCSVCNYNTDSPYDCLVHYNHCIQCPFGKTLPDRPLVYQCNDCAAVSTSVNLVAEHIQKEHGDFSSVRIMVYDLLKYDNASGLSQLDIKTCSSASPIIAKTTETIHLPLYFDINAFTSAFHQLLKTPAGICLKDVVLESVLTKFRTFSVFKLIVIQQSGKEPNYRCPVCPVEFPNRIAEAKLHLLKEHLNCQCELAHFALRFTNSIHDPTTVKMEEIMSSNQDLITSKTMERNLVDISRNPRNTSDVEQAIGAAPQHRGGIIRNDFHDDTLIEILPSVDSKKPFRPIQGFHKVASSYSLNVLQQLLKPLGISETEEAATINRMNTFAKVLVLLRVKRGFRLYGCSACAPNNTFHSSSLTALKRHILIQHCGFEEKSPLLEPCMLASRTHGRTFQLLPDNVLLGEVQSPAPQYSSDKRCFSKPPRREDALHSRSHREKPQELRLCFSSNVLKILLEKSEFASSLEDLLKKMEMYASCRIHVFRPNGFRVPAFSFECSCGQRFLPNQHNVSNRLLDCQRHVMITHARIPYPLVRFCTQAARLTWRNGKFSLPPDESLLSFSENKSSPSPTCIVNEGENSSSPVGKPPNLLPSGLAISDGWCLAYTKPLSINMGAFTELVRHCLPSDVSSHEQLTETTRDLLQCFEVYSRHCIYVLSMPGRYQPRRAFCCSVCPFSSQRPHNGDTYVKRHILAEHARLPPEFLEIALRASVSSKRPEGSEVTFDDRNQTEGPSEAKKPRHQSIDCGPSDAKKPRF